MSERIDINREVREGLREAFGMAHRNRAGRRKFMRQRGSSGGSKAPRPKRHQATRDAARRAAKSRAANRP